MTLKIHENHTKSNKCCMSNVQIKKKKKIVGIALELLIISNLFLHRPIYTISCHFISLNEQGKRCLL